MTTVDAKIQSPRSATHRKARGWARVGLGFAAMVLILISGVWFVVWWQEAPIRNADKLLQSGKSQAALTMIDQFLRSSPQHSGAKAVKARILVEIGHPRQAIRLFEEVGASEPIDLHVWAQALLKLEQWSAALPVLEFVRTTGIDEADVLHELAACRSKIGDFDGAISAAEEFSRMPGGAARGNLLLGTIHHERGNLRLAASAWDSVLKASPNGEDLQIEPSQFFLEYGRVLLAMGEASPAAELIGRSLKSHRDTSALISFGEANLQLGNAEEARAAFKESLASNFYSVAARKGLASLAMTEGNAQGALDFLNPLKDSPAISSEIAFLFQRANVRLGNTESANHWRDVADKLRRQENARSAADQILRDMPESNWADVIRAYRFALDENWEQADVILKTLGQKSLEQPFIQELCQAVKSHAEPPSLEKLPLREQ